MQVSEFSTCRTVFSTSKFLFDSWFRSTFRPHFAEIDDPRIERTKRHKLTDILTIAQGERILSE
jgi:hypothetical protein